MHGQLEQVATYPMIRLALRLILLTMVRKSELIEATWDKVDFEAAVWTIPKSRMKARCPHNVYLSRQSIDIMVALHTCAAGSRYVLPSRYAADRCMSKATLNRVTQLVAERAKAAGLPLQPFTVHDLRRTSSTLLSEAGFNGDWIEKSLAHGGDGRSSTAVYNRRPSMAFSVGTCSRSTSSSRHSPQITDWRVIGRALCLDTPSWAFARVRRVIPELHEDLRNRHHFTWCVGTFCQCKSGSSCVRSIFSIEFAWVEPEQSEDCRRDLRRLDAVVNDLV